MEEELGFSNRWRMAGVKLHHTPYHFVHYYLVFFRKKLHVGRGRGLQCRHCVCSRLVVWLALHSLVIVYKVVQGTKCCRAVRRSTRLVRPIHAAIIRCRSKLFARYETLGVPRAASAASAKLLFRYRSKRFALGSSFAYLLC